MDVAAIRSLMRKTQASILENGFLGFDDPKHVSVTVLFHSRFQNLRFVFLDISWVGFAELWLKGSDFPCAPNFQFWVPLNF